MTPCMGQDLGGFKLRVSRRITERKPKRQVGGILEELPLNMEIQEAGFEDIGEYVLKKYNTVAQ